MSESLKPGFQSYLRFKTYQIELIYTRHFIELLAEKGIDSQIAYNKIYEGIGQMVRKWEKDQKPIRTSIISISTRIQFVCVLNENKGLKLYATNVISDRNFRTKNKVGMYYYLSKVMRFDPTVEDIIVKDLVMIDMEKRVKKIKKNGYYHFKGSMVTYDLLRHNKNDMVVLYAEWIKPPVIIGVD